MAFNLPSASATATADWTVMVYMTASNLADYAAANINQMEQAAADLPGTVHFAVLLDQSSAGQTFVTPVAGGAPSAWGGTGEAIIQQDTDASHIVTTFNVLPNDLDTGDPASLTQFINWATANAPAQHYALILWDHGNGVGGVNFDTLDGAAPDHLTIPEVASAIAASQLEATQGHTLDLLAFDACKMAMAEVDASLNSVAGEIVASEETEGGAGYDYSTAFSVLANQPNLVDGKTLAAGLVRSYQQQYQGDPGGADTLSAVSSTNLNALEAALQAFTTAMAAAPASDWNAVRAARDAATAFHGSPDYRDLGQFMTVIADPNAATSSAVRNAAQGVLTAIGQTVTAKTSDARRTSGLSIYLPAPGTQLDADYVSQFADFFTDTGWSSFLAKFVSGTSASVSADWAESDNTPAQAYNLHRLAGGNHLYSGLNLDSPDDVDFFQFFIAAGGGAGDDVALTPQGGQATITLYAGSDTTTPILQSPLSAEPQSLSLAGRPAGQYFLKISGDGGHALDAYTLRIDAPAAVFTNVNDTQAKSLDLGVIGGETVLNGLAIPNSDAWFTFRTPRTASPTPGAVHIDPQGQPLTATLLDSQGQTLGSASGSGELELGYPSENEDGAAYFLHLSTGDAVQRSLSPSAASTPINLDLAPSAGSLAFASAAFDVDKGDGVATIAITRGGGSDGQVTVHYATSDGSAIAGSDYTATSGDLTFPAGVTTASFQVPINAASILNHEVTVNLTLSDPQGGAALGALAQAVLTIQSPTYLPILAWSDPADITYGTPLGAAQLDATADVPGTFSYTLADGTTVASGAVLNAGPNQTLMVSFTPTDTTDYTTAAAQVQITVDPAALTVKANDANRAYGAPNPAFTDTITGFVNGDGPSVVSGAAALTTTATTDSLVGNYPISATRGTLAAANYTFAFQSGTLTITVNSQGTFGVAEDMYVIGSGTVNVSAADGVLSNDSGPGLLTVTTATVAGAEGGTFVWHADGSFSYTPPADFPGFDYAKYTANDAQGDQANATVNVLSQTGGVVWKFYESVLHRNPDYGGLQYWINDFTGGGKTGDIAAGFFESTELLDQIIGGYYEQYLGRAADAHGVNYYIDLWRKTGGPEQIKAGFASSPEFNALAKTEYGNYPDGWLQALYHRILNRTPDPDGFDYWKGQLAGGTSEYQVALDFFTSPEAFDNDVTGWFYEYLDRAPRLAEQAQYANQMTGGATDRDTEQAITNLPEYGANPPASPPGTGARLPDYLPQAGSAKNQAATDAFFAAF